MTDLEGFAVT